MSRALVVAEIALAFALLAMSAILIVHVRDLSRVPTGLNPDGLLTFSLTLPVQAADSGQRTQLQKRLLDAVRTAPGVAAATFANQLPLGRLLSGRNGPRRGPSGGRSTRAGSASCSPRPPIRRRWPWRCAPGDS